jgi:hypothetical protein
MPLTKRHVKKQGLVSTFENLNRFPPVYRAMVDKLSELVDKGWNCDCETALETILGCAWIGENQQNIDERYRHPELHEITADTWITQQIGLTAEGGLAEIAKTIDAQMEDLFQKATEEKLELFFEELARSARCLNGRIVAIQEFKATMLEGIPAGALSDTVSDSTLAINIQDAFDKLGYKWEEMEQMGIDTFRSEFKLKVAAANLTGQPVKVHELKIDLQHINFDDCFNKAWEFYQYS